MTFSSYWKEVAVILAGLFAIGGVLSDIRDKRTKKFTIWGRIFFILTVLSTLGGLYAQWIDNKAEEQRNHQAQEAMLNLLGRTEQSVLDLSRVLQPLAKPKVTVILKVECSHSADGALAWSKAVGLSSAKTQ